MKTVTLTWRRILPLLPLLIMLPACSDDGPSRETGESAAEEQASTQPDFAYLHESHNGFETTHGLRYRFTTSDTLTSVGPLHRTDRFNDVPYEISLAGFVSPEAAVMLHAERVADGSGASNYDDLPLAAWPDGRFRSGGAAVMDVPIEERDGEHDLRWLHDNGFDPVGRLVVQQFFATTPDHNDEIVVTLMRRVPQDEADSQSASATALDDLRSMVTIAPLAHE